MEQAKINKSLQKCAIKAVIFDFDRKQNLRV